MSRPQRILHARVPGAVFEMRVMNLSKHQSQPCSTSRCWVALAAGCLFAFLAFGHRTKAQVSAAISGRVTDPSGAAVSGATVTARNLETEAVRTTSTDDAGRYAVLSLAV